MWNEKMWLVIYSNDSSQIRWFDECKEYFLIWVIKALIDCKFLISVEKLKDWTLKLLGEGYSHIICEAQIVSELQGFEFLKVSYLEEGI